MRAGYRRSEKIPSVHSHEYITTTLFRLNSRKFLRRFATLFLYSRTVHGISKENFKATSKSKREVRGPASSSEKIRRTKNVKGASAQRRSRSGFANRAAARGTSSKPTRLFAPT